MFRGFIRYSAVSSIYEYASLHGELRFDILQARQARGGIIHNIVVSVADKVVINFTLDAIHNPLLTIPPDVS
jgi:hypothetical protein